MKLKVGIFDSGIGGFTILNSLLKTRTDVEVFYLADTKRIPFGNKNFKEIRLIAKEICTFFEDKNLDALLIACNTTNACALDILENNLRVPCFDLINSVSEIVDKQLIGVLATQTTVKSSYYKNAISSKKENLKIFQQECPKLLRFVKRFHVRQGRQELAASRIGIHAFKIQITHLQPPHHSGINIILLLTLYPSCNNFFA